LNRLAATPEEALAGIRLPDNIRFSPDMFEKGFVCDNVASKFLVRNDRPPFINRRMKGVNLTD
jgi:hypothetical protein